MKLEEASRLANDAEMTPKDQHTEPTSYGLPGAVSSFASSCQVLNSSPCVLRTSKRHLSPFLPFCRENLSPLKDSEESFTSSNINSVLLSPM